MSTGSNRYRYRDGLAVLSTWSDRRHTTAAVVREWIGANSATAVDLADIGTGDGELLDLSIQPLENLRSLMAVEPDHVLREQAVARLVGSGWRPEVLRFADSMDQYPPGICTHVLAAHVLYHLAAPEDGLAAMRRLLRLGGEICVVIGSEDCDAYRMRQIVRAHEGVRPAVTADTVTAGLREVGFRDVVVRSAPAVLQTTSAVSVSEQGTRTFTHDPSFDLFIRWMTRLPEDGPVDRDLMERLRAFLVRRSGPQGIELSLEDLVITAVVDDGAQRPRAPEADGHPDEPRGSR